MSRTKIKVHQSSGNVFADLKLPDANAHMLKAQIVADLYRLTQTRKPTQTRVADIAESLNVPAGELIRDLTEDEAREWAFYRTSAQHRTEVWRSAQYLWNRSGLSLRQAAKVMEVHPWIVCRSIAGRRATVLTYQQALRIVSALPEPLEPEAVLPEIARRR